MKITILIFLVLFVTIAHCHDFHSDSSPTLLTIEDFSEFTKEFSFIVMFAPWCGHCRALMPTLERMIQEKINEKEVKYQIGAVDCTVEKEICGRYHVRGYPTLFAFYEGELVTEYEGRRTMEGLNQWMVNLGKKIPSSGAVGDLAKGEFDEVTLRIGSKHVVHFYWGEMEELDMLENWAEQASGSDLHVHGVNCRQESLLCDSFDVREGDTPTFLISGKQMARIDLDGSDITKLERTWDTIRKIPRPGFMQTSEGSNEKMLILAVVCGVIVIFLFCVLTMVCFIGDDDEEEDAMDEQEFIQSKKAE